VDNHNSPFYQNSGRKLLLSHMVADSLDELHEMAEKIGVQRKWFQSGSTPHYDVCQTKRKLAILCGAISVDKRGMVEICKNLRKLNDKTASRRLP
jgi:hypothetical protein